MDLSKLGDAI